MDLDLSPEQAELRRSLREYFADLMGDGAKHLGRGEHRTEADKAVLRRMGADGWLAVGFPAEYGGLGFGPVEQFIFLEEARRAGAPLSSVTIMTIGPSIVRFGTDEQKERYVPGILRGEITFAVGYSEPDAGTDLGRLRTRAVRDGEEYVITGQKYWTSGGDSADYIWLAARTDPESIGYEGVSLFIVPTTSPGFRYSVVRTLASHRTTATYYEEVRVPATAMVGRENHGWDVVTSQLNLERLMMIMPGPVEELFSDLVAWCREPQAGGRRPIDEPWIQMELAAVQAGLRALRVLVWRAVSEAARQQVNPGDVSAVKVFGSELYVDACRRMLEVAGEAGVVVEGSPGAVLAGRLEEAYRTAAIKTFGGGVNEVQREIVGRHRLGLPRVARPSDRGR